MAKELPYFKFEPAEWLTGRISLESFEAQGAFLNLCCLYWQRLGEVKEKEARLRLKDNFDLLHSSEMFGITSGKITIKFLDIQLEERIKISNKRSEIGRKGGQAKAKQLPSKSKAVAKQNRIEENRVDIKENFLRLNTRWRDDFLKHYSISLEEYLKHLSVFELQADMNRDEQEVRRHFFNWIKSRDLVKTKRIIHSFDDMTPDDIK